MTDRPAPLSLPYPVPSQTISSLPTGPIVKDEVTLEAETVEEEPYTIKCICNFSDDDGNTIFCETCDTWQHIECFYPDNKEEALNPDFIHSCAECKPRPLNRAKAIDRAQRLKNPTPVEGQAEKKPRRPPSKSHKKKPKPAEALVNGLNGVVDHGVKPVQVENPPAKKTKTHRSSQSISHPSTKRSPSQGNIKNPSHPQSPATTPPNLPDGFHIHHYSPAWLSSADGPDFVESKDNTFANLAVTTHLSRWLHEPGKMKEEAGRTPSEVFQETPPDLEVDPESKETKEAKVQVELSERVVNPDKVLRWRYLRSTQAVDKDVPLVQLFGELGFQKDYCANPDNFWGEISSPLPYVFFHPSLPLYIDTRKEGSIARYVRRSCQPNSQLDTYLVRGSEYHFWVVSERHIEANEQITLPWEFRLDTRVRARWLMLLGLSDDPPSGDEPEMDDAEYDAISNWIDRILSEFGGCACDSGNQCAFAQFHRRWLYAKNTSRTSNGKKKSRKPRPQTLSPTSTGHATNSRAASEGNGEEVQDEDAKSQSESTRSKPPSRDPTPARQGSFDQLGIITGLTDRDKRKVAKVEESFRRLEQQPPKKKKRISDGTNSSKKQRHGSTTSQGHYVDAGTGRSKSGSPTNVQSPQFSTSSAKSPAMVQSERRPRQESTSVRPVYCDASVQTDTVEGAWFTVCEPSPKPRKIIPLCRRLMRNRVHFEEALQRKASVTPQTPSVSAMDIDSPTHARAASEHEATSQSGDAIMTDVAVESPTAESPTSKAPDLRVQMPPVPAFDGSAAPLGTPSSITQAHSPIPIHSTLPLGPGANNSMVNPSPAKKKLSLSDYTKRSKASKVVGGNTIIKPTLPSPEEMKVDITLDMHIDEKRDDENNVGTTAPSTNGHL